MPTIEAIRKMVERNEGVAFLPKMCVKEELRHGLVKEVTVPINLSLEELRQHRRLRLKITLDVNLLS